MAVVVPFIMAAAGATATTIAITSVAFAVTGLNAKINKAAGKVFGEDLVKIGNLFGAAYSAWNGGFDIGGSSGAAEAASTVASTGSESVAGVDAFGSTSDLINAGTDAASSAATGGMNLSSMAADPLAAGADLMRIGDTASSVGSYLNPATDTAGLSAPAAASQSAADGSLLSYENAYSDVYQPGGASTTGATAQSSTSMNPVATTSDATGASATGAKAAGAKAAGGQASQATTAPRSFFEKLMYDERGNIKPAALQLGGNLIQGVGSGYTAGQANKQRAAELAESRRRTNISTGLRVTN